MIDDTDQPLEKRFHEDMVEGYLDGLKPDNPEPSANRSHSYRHGFANGRDDMTHSPRLPAQVLRLLADQAIRDDVLVAKGLGGTTSRQSESQKNIPPKASGASPKDTA